MFVNDAATRAAAYLLAEAILLLLRAVLAHCEDAGHPGMIALRDGLESLAADLKRIGDTGDLPADADAAGSAPPDTTPPPPASTRRTPPRAMPRALAPRPRDAARAENPPGRRRPATLQPAALPHA